MLSAGGRHVGQPRAVIHFLEETGLADREDWDDLACIGQTRSLLATVPAALKPDLEAFQSHLDDERQYRNTTGERCRQRQTDQGYFVMLVFYARWLDAHAFTSWQQLTPERFRAAAETHGPAMPLHTAIHHVYLLKHFMAFLHEEHRIFRNPLAALRRPAIPMMREKLVTATELHRVVQLIADTSLDPLPRAIGALVAMHGLATAELIALRVGDYNARTRRLTVRRRRLSIPIDPVTHEALVAYLAKRYDTRHNPFLFVTRRTWKDGRPATDGFFASQFHRLGIRGGAQAFRRTLLREVLLSENSVVAQRLFAISRGQIDRHSCQLGAEKFWQYQMVDNRVQDSL
jgi:site-specific recombinase XerC